MRSLLACVLFLISAGLSAGQKKPFTLADLYRLKSVSDPQIAPDGRRVAIVVTDHDLARGKSNSDVYVVGIGGGNPRRLTYGKKSDSHPRWSADGTSLLFVSSRTGTPQIYIMNMAGGEPRRLTSLSTGASQPRWSPDGKFVVFRSSVFPEYGANAKKNKRDLDAMKKGPVQAHLADRLFYRHWNAWLDGRRRHLFAAEVKTGKVIELTPGDRDVPPRFFQSGEGFSISPDGRDVCYVANPDPDPWQSTNGDLFVVPIRGGPAKNLTRANRAWDGHPKYSPDGRFIAFIKHEVPGYEADRFRLAVFDRTSGRVRTLTEDFDYWVGDFEWGPDSRTLYFTADHRGHVPLFKVGVGEGDGKVSEVVPGPDVKTIDDFRISPDGQWAVLTRRSVGEPVELFRASLRAEGAELQRLTFFNQKVEKEVDIRPAESMWVDGAGGKPVHVFLVKPHGFDPNRKYPLILNVRGGPQGMWADAFRGDWQVYPGAGYVVAFPNPTGSTGYGQAYTEAISRDWGGRVYEDLMKVTDALAALPYVDANRMGAMGWSWGGYMMMWFEGHTDRFAALAAMMGVYDLESMYRTTEELWFPDWDFGGPPWGGSPVYAKFSPSDFVKNFKTPCLVITGERDFRVSYTQSIQFFTDLQKMKVPSRLIVFKNDGHWPGWVKSMPLYYNAHLDWFHRYLGGKPAPYDMTKMVRNRVFGVEKKAKE
jgi:dipeptidyl aminopeptidase/acylaminoacyl peptidase